ncbi:hypothetical protein [Aeromonas veronii]|uniref:hypothetical protein n=1 Tax=Aeromonas veronii TaxID=654 RepID=UPI001115DA81|nr:hypothetical protein [Aeromonas veronii]
MAMKLKNSVIANIVYELDAYDFSKEDFEIIHPDQSEKLISIVFKPVPEYIFHITEGLSGGIRFIADITRGHSSDKDLSIRTHETPGNYKKTEIHKHADVGEAIYRIRPWISNIIDDLRYKKSAHSSTSDATQEEFIATFQASVDEQVENKDDYFSKDEENSILQRLDELEEKIKSLEENLTITPDESKKISDAVDSGRQTIKYYTKGVWYKTTGSKLFKVMKNLMSTQEGREVISHAAKKLIDVVTN